MSTSHHRSLTVEKLLAEAELSQARLIGDSTRVVSGIGIDSRTVGAGDVLCCFRGEKVDGHAFIADAHRAGVNTFVVEHEVDLPNDCVQIVVPRTREVVGVLASVLHDRPSDSMRVIGITGTNGKTSTAALLGNILLRNDRPTRVYGTLTGERTTPEAPELQSRLAECREDGISHVVMEVSSHALAQHRVDGTSFALAVFTNLGRDHLDFHESQEAYFAAKARLFEAELSARAVVNLDDPHGLLLRDSVSIPVTGFSLSEVSDLSVSARLVSFTWRDTRVSAAVGGAFNVVNVLAACTAACELGLSPSEIADGLRDFPGVRGRFEYVDEGQDFGIVVDYAHTPEALEQLLFTARKVAEGRVIVVFGCGGDRDAGKRPLMGRAAQALADVVYVTSDNPRSEKPEAIVADIVAGCDRDGMMPIVEIAREQAISEAVFSARTNDIVVIAGKGHETVQEFADRVVAFDDVAVARDAVRRRSAFA